MVLEDLRALPHSLLVVAEVSLPGRRLSPRHRRPSRYSLVLPTSGFYERCLRAGARRGAGWRCICCSET